MDWFKHDSNSTQDAKLKKLLIKHGAVGYAVYFHSLELIVSDISRENLTFRLEHDAEIIADNLRVKGTATRSGVEIVEEIMRYILDLGLFTESQGNIHCFKILKRLDSSMTSNTKFRKEITEARDKYSDIIDGKTPKLPESAGGHDGIMTVSWRGHEGVMKEQNRSRTESEQKKKKKPFSFVGHDIMDKSHDGGNIRTDSGETQEIDVDGQTRYKHTASRIDKWIRKSSEMNSFPTERKSIVSKSNFSEIQDNLSYYRQEEIDTILSTYEDIYNSADHEPHAEFTSISNFLANDNIKLYLPENNPMQRFQRSSGFAGSYRIDYTQDDYEQTMKLIQEKG